MGGLRAVLCKLIAATTSEVLVALCTRQMHYFCVLLLLSETVDNVVHPACVCANVRLANEELPDS